MTRRHQILRTRDVFADESFVKELEEALTQRDDRLGLSVATTAAAATSQPVTLPQSVAFARSRAQLEIAAQHWLRSTCNLLEPDQAVRTWLQLVEIERRAMAAATAATEDAKLKRFDSSGEPLTIAPAA